MRDPPLERGHGTDQGIECRRRWLPMEQPTGNPESSADSVPASPRARSAERNKALVRRVYEEGLNRGDLAVLDELIDERLIDHSLFPGGGTGRDSFKRRFSLVRAAFPDAS